MSPKLLSVIGLVGLALGGLAVYSYEAPGFDERVPVGGGGTLDVDIVLGGGFSFDHGSLHIRSHDADDVRVQADVSGWGAYAVDLDLSHEGERAELIGRVDGPLDWMFGGPTVNVSVWVPRDFTVDASIQGGPLVLEDLVGPLVANVDEDVTLRRVEGKVRLDSARGAVEVEDVDGELSVRSERGDIEVTGVRGLLSVTAERGEVEIESVTGDVEVESDSGSVEVEDVRGDATITTGRGRIEAGQIRGTIVANTDRGGIELDEIDGEVRAHSRRGSIEVEFDGDPVGEIETGHGSIEIEVPEGAAFDLVARTERGRIRIGDDADEFGDDDDAEDDDDGDERRLGRRRPEELARAINGGGGRLQLRTGRGTIRIDD